MCVGVGTALIIGTIASAAVSAGAAVFSGIQQNKIGKANARQAEIDAERTRQVGRINEQQAREQMRRSMAKQRAGLAAAGFTLSEGSAVDLGADAGEQAFLDAQAVRSGADARARALDFEGRLARASGKMSLFTGFAKGGAIGLGGANRAFKLAE